VELEVRYVTTSDAVRIAYAIAGSGPPMVTFTDPIASHVQLAWSHPVLGRFFQEKARWNTVLFFDVRGCACQTAYRFKIWTIRSAMPRP